MVKKLGVLARSLLSLPAKSSGSGNIMITQSAFSVLSCFFGKPIDVSTSSSNEITPQEQVTVTSYVQESYSSIDDLELMHSVLVSLLTLRPNQNDSVLTPIWSKLLGIGFVRYAREAIQTESKIHEMLAEELIDQEEAVAFQAHNDTLLPALVGEFVTGSFAHLMGASTSEIVIASAGKAFAAVAKGCVTDGMIAQAYLGKEEGVINPLADFLTLLDASLKDIRYRDALAGVLDIAGCMFEVCDSVLIVSDLGESMRLLLSQFCKSWLCFAIILPIIRRSLANQISSLR
jgi:hypothetical protein